MRIAVAVIHRQTGFPAMWGALAGLRLPAGVPRLLIEVEGTSVARQRNQCVQTALDQGADWMLFIDDDHVFAPDALLRLLAHDVDIVGGLYITKIPPHFATAYLESPDEDKMRSLTPEQQASGGIVRVDSLGMGFTLIRMSVFAKVEPPWFRLGQQAPDEMGEDIYFCRQAGKAGVQAYCDVTLKVPHLSVMAIVPDGADVRAMAPAEAMRFAERSRAPESALVE